MDVRLILNSGSQKGRETLLARGIYLVGRSSICQIRPKNRYVSRKHCALVHRKRDLLIQDLGSKSGTFVNGKRIDPKTALALNDGDRIRVGKTRFLIAIKAPPEAVARKGKPKTESPEVLDKNVGEELSLAYSNSNKGPSQGEVDSSGVGSGVNVGAHMVEDVLSMLEEDGDENGEEEVGMPGTQFKLSRIDGSDVDVDDDSDGNVEFAAPRSSESLSEVQPLPSYASRKDWDVQSVYNWVNQKETFARLDQRRARRKAKALAAGETAAEQGEVSTQVADGTQSQTSEVALEARAKLGSQQAVVAKSNPSNKWSAWIESDTARPIVLVTVGALFALWIAWNAWVLFSFKG